MHRTMGYKQGCKTMSTAINIVGHYVKNKEHPKKIVFQLTALQPHGETVLNFLTSVS